MLNQCNHTRQLGNHLIDAEESVVDSRRSVFGCRVVGAEQLEFELQSSVGRHGPTHPKQVGGYSESAQRHGDEVDGVGEWGVQTVGVAPSTCERFALTAYASDNSTASMSYLLNFLLLARYVPNVAKEEL